MKARLLVVCLLALAATVVNGATDFTGRWKVTITLGDQRLVGIALLQQSGDNVSGSIGADERNQHPLDGVVEGNRVTLTTHPRPGATAAFAKAHLILDGEKLTGTTEGGDLNGTAAIELVREK
ncbi:MAG TPA: hypothetical protein VFP91_14400 [Vicinamibacterales bacterium]|nr:hypothetical protein [Vicinamibacterales bacterium]